MARGAFFDHDTLSPNLKHLMPAIDAGVDLAFDSMVPVAEGHMRSNAPWTDRTGNARNGLRARHVANPMVSHELILYHTMPYGIWLEVRWSGRYAIIGPTIQEIGPDVMERTAASIAMAIRMMGAFG